MLLKFECKINYKSLIPKDVWKYNPHSFWIMKFQFSFYQLLNRVSLFMD